MKLNKKKVLALALAVCLVAILSFSTLAWFSDSDSVTNQFHTATSDDEDPDDIFSVDIFEYTDSDGDGNKELVDYQDSEGDGVYNDVLPGDVLYKEPIIQNTGRYDQWVRVSITVDQATFWKNIVPAGSDLTAIFTPVDDFDTLWKWGEINEDAASNTITYVYYLQKKLVKNETVGVFTNVTIPSSLTQEQIFALGTNGFSITLKADAVQADNTGDTAEEAFALVERTQAI